MWLQSLFGKSESKKYAQIKDRVLMQQAGKEQAILALAKKEPEIRLVYWFRETGEHYRKLLQANGLPAERVLEATTLRLADRTSDQLVFIERYPLAEKEKEVMEHWPDGTYIAYSSLDEPLFLHFGSERIAKMMETLGMKSDEVVEHNMISSSLSRGQEKIAQQVSFDQGANSQADWMRKHIQPNNV